jgi:hypothetical protein
VQLRAILANLAFLLVAVGVTGSHHLIRFLGPECG